MSVTELAPPTQIAYPPCLPASIPAHLHPAAHVCAQPHRARAQHRIQLSTRNSEHVGQVAARSLSEIAYPDSLLRVHIIIPLRQCIVEESQPAAIQSLSGAVAALNSLAAYQKRTISFKVPTVLQRNCRWTGEGWWVVKFKLIEE